MNLAVISDVHANLVSLNIVLKDLEDRKIDRIVCLGDVATSGPQPHQVIERLKGLNIPTVMGNTDAWIVGPKTDDRMVADPRVIEIDRWCASQLTESDYDFLNALVPNIEIELGDHVSLFGYHASPRSNTELIVASTPAEDLDKMLSGVSAPIMAGGHTHVQMVRCHRDKLLFNPGSVGLPTEFRDNEALNFRNPPRADYAIVRLEKRNISIELRRVALDWSEIASSAEQAGMPFAKLWGTLAKWRRRGYLD